jgi:hypothetical protein
MRTCPSPFSPHEVCHFHGSRAMVLQLICFVTGRFPDMRSPTNKRKCCRPPKSCLIWQRRADFQARGQSLSRKANKRISCRSVLPYARYCPTGESAAISVFSSTPSRCARKNQGNRLLLIKRRKIHPGRWLVLPCRFDPRWPSLAPYHCPSYQSNHVRGPGCSSKNHAPDASVAWKHTCCPTSPTGTTLYSFRENPYSARP